jgi:CheY-like chemotaxis protein
MVSKKKMKVLLVDDVGFFRELMRDYFSRTSVDVLMAKDGEEALAAALKEPPDLIYMDVAMPVMDGLTACRRIKTHPALSSIPVLLIFTPGRDAAEQDVVLTQCDGYLKKPFGREDFLNLAHRHLFHLERRKRRIPCNVPVEFTINGLHYTSRCHDISLNGLYIEYQHELPPEKRIEVKFSLPDNPQNMIAAEGEIAWINQGSQRQKMKVPQGFGIKTQLIKAADVNRIQNYIDAV